MKNGEDRNSQRMNETERRGKGGGDSTQFTFKMERETAFFVMRWKVRCLRLERLARVRESSTLYLSHREYWRVTCNTNTKIKQHPDSVQNNRPQSGNSPPTLYQLSLSLRGLSNYEVLQRQLRIAITTVDQNGFYSWEKQYTPTHPNLPDRLS